MNKTYQEQGSMKFTESWYHLSKRQFKKVPHNSVGATRGPRMLGCVGVCQEGWGGGLLSVLGCLKTQEAETLSSLSQPLLVISVQSWGLQTFTSSPA